MKKLFLILLMIPFYSCVDKDFDLGKIDDSGIVLGNEFVVPIGTIELNVAKLLTGNPIPPGGVSGEVDVPDELSETIDVDAGIDQDILDKIADGGDQSVYAEVKNPLNVSFKIKISFIMPPVDGAGNGAEIEIVNGVINPEISLLKMDNITKEVLEQFAKSNKLKIDFNYLSGDKKVTFDEYEKMEFNLKLLRKGGIKF